METRPGQLVYKDFVHMRPNTKLLMHNTNDPGYPYKTEKIQFIKLFLKKRGDYAGGMTWYMEFRYESGNVIKHPLYCLGAVNKLNPASTRWSRYCWLERNNEKT